jgi:3-methylcrotonyl-CoA carboxylase alpha subunit
MGAAAVALVNHVGYRGAGTVEFLLQDNQFYFMEMNTRLQVEHPVTEMILGIDLVKAQIVTAQDQMVWSRGNDFKPRGHSIECRLYAENPFQGGVPSTGLLGMIQWPEAYGRRFEYGFDEGDEITPYYDPMIAKLIVWDENRTLAIKKMLKVLEESVVFGVHTNIPLLEKIVSHPEFVDGSMTTRFFETYFSESLPSPEVSVDTKEFIELATRRLSAGSGVSESTNANPWAGFWRNV